MPAVPLYESERYGRQPSNRNLPERPRYHRHLLPVRVGVHPRTDERLAGISYVARRREGIRIGARQITEPIPRDARRLPAGTEIVLEVDDLHAERDRILAAGYELAEDLTARSWGLTDLRLFDPDGYYLRLTTH